MFFVITEPCIDNKDASCVEVCPVNCIASTPDARQYFINPDDCISCGACVDVCPVDAIYHRDDLPEDMISFVQINARFFAPTPPNGAM